MDGKYSIEAVSYSIMGLGSHDFWALKDDSGNVIAELHGLATSRRTGEPVPVGTSDEHSIRMFAMKSDNLSGFYNSDNSHRVFLGPVDEVMARWNNAIAAQKNH